MSLLGIKKCCFVLLATGLIDKGLCASVVTAAKPSKTSKKETVSVSEEESPSREEGILRGQTPFSMAAWLAGYQPQNDLSIYFPADSEKLPAVNRSVLELEWKSALPKFLSLKAQQDQQVAFARGDLEKGEVREKMRHLLRLSLLRLRLIEGNQVSLWLESEGRIWESALSALAFDEATPLGLRTSVELRQEIWHELLRKAKTRQDLPWDELRGHVDRVQPAWPIDRIVVAESRRVLPPAAQRVADGIGIELQKNPQRSVKTVRQRMRGGEMKDLAVLDDLWTDADVQRMRDERNLLLEIRRLSQK